MASRRRHKAAATILALAAVAGCGSDSGDAREAPESVRRAVPWDFVAVEDSGRALRIAYTYGGCQHDPRATVVESPATVRVAVTVAEPTGEEVVCTAIARLAREAVTLEDPLRGRRLLGWSGSAQPPRSRRCGRRPQLPSLRGLAAADARAALHSLGLDARGATRGEVVRQRPRAGACVKPGQPVTLVGR